MASCDGERETTDHHPDDERASCSDAEPAERVRSGQDFVVEAFRVTETSAGVAACEGVMAEMEAPIRRAMKAFESPSDAADEVVRPTTHEEAAMDRLVMDSVDPHHAAVSPIHTSTQPHQWSIDCPMTTRAT